MDGKRVSGQDLGVQVKRLKAKLTRPQLYLQTLGRYSTSRQSDEEQISRSIDSSGRGPPSRSLNSYRPRQERSLLQMLTGSRPTVLSVGNSIGRRGYP